MAVLEIITIGHKTLKRRAEEVKNINDEVVELAKSMVETMHSAPGIGLAAPQVDKSIRLIVVDLSVGEKKEDLIVLVNPEIVDSGGEDTALEGCLSVPDVQEKVTRPFQAVVRGTDLDGKERLFEADDLLARVFCHEIDHLDGKLFVDHLSPLKKSLIRKKLKKQFPL
jgi:peptide deformylase